jgi:tRNA threonylcarbamoyladenosine biosynthesis protein TsaB
VNVLAIETSGRAGTIALARAGGIAERELEGPADQTLMGAILDLADLRALDGVAVGLGPGMFTSMRVGIATAKTLAASLGLRVAAVCSLDLVARAAVEAGAPPVRDGDPASASAPRQEDAGPQTVVARADAGRGEVYVATYLAVPFQRMGEIEIVRADEFAPPQGALLADGAPRAATLATLAAGMFERGETLAPNEVEPLYVRRTDAEINWERRGGVARPADVKARGE